MPSTAMITDRLDDLETRARGLENLIGQVIYNQAQETAIAMSLDACGNGVLSFGLRPGNADTAAHTVDGVYVSTTGSGTCAGAPPTACRTAFCVVL